MQTNATFNSIKIISKDEYDSLTQGYLDFVSVNAMLNGLLIRDNEYLSSYKVDIEYFRYMINAGSPINVWRLRFGLDLTQSDLLQIMLVGMANNGDIVTPYFQLTQPEMLPMSGLYSKIAVSNDDMQQWINQYISNIESNTIVKGNFSSPYNSPNILHGYNYFSSDFSESIKNDANVNSKVFFTFIIYTNTAPVSHQNMFGVAVGDFGDLSPNFRFYDLSKPCPPTC
jgi:hypothetical protein